MSTKFYTLLTDIGAAKLASAAALGVPLKITHMAAMAAEHYQRRTQSRQHW